MRVLLHCQSLTGVGHHVRALAVARELARGHDVLFATGTRRFPGDRDAPGVGFLELPEVWRDGGRLAGGSPVTRATRLAEAAREFAPDVVVVEHYPFGKHELAGEIGALLDAAPAESRVVCSVRDIVLRGRYDAGAAHEDAVLRALERFSLVLVHGDPSLVRLSDHAPWTARAAAPFEYTGYVARPSGPPPPEAAGAVVLSAGGGGDAADFWDAARAALRGRRVVAFAGPYAPEPDFTRDLGAWLSGCALSVSRAGYNTCVDLLAARARAVLVPSPRMADQRLRARRLAELGLAVCVDDVAGLPAAVERALASPAPPPHGIRLDGAARTREILEGGSGAAAVPHLVVVTCLQQPSCACSHGTEYMHRVGRGTPGGELLRRYWQPVAAACRLADHRPHAVRILGEDLVAFRHAGGYGLVEERCPHRGTSLAYGLAEPDGIRCCYHGWKFSPDGACLELPAEPDDSPLYRRARVKAYPARELGGLVWGYLGPDPAPLLPRWDVLVWDNALRDIGQAVLPCNWLQIMENSVAHHTEWLHGHHLADVQARQGKERPQHYLRRHEKIGFDVFRFGIVKRRMLEGGSEEDDDWRIGHPLIFPNSLRVGEAGRHRMQIRVPIDDTHTWHLWYTCYRVADGVEAPAQDEIPLYDVKWRDDNGGFLVDFVDGGDIMAWVTQGPIADRSREMLGASDKGIALYRRLLREEMAKVERGEDPLGLLRDARENEILELPQERNKYGAGWDFLLRSLEDGHARYSPLKERLAELVRRAKAAT